MYTLLTSIFIWIIFNFVKRIFLNGVHNIIRHQLCFTEKVSHKNVTLEKIFLEVQYTFIELISCQSIITLKTQGFSFSDNITYVQCNPFIKSNLNV